MYQCRLHDLIVEKRVAVGMYMVSGSPMAAEIIGQTGLDFVIIETEHGRVFSQFVFHGGDLLGFQPFI